jgi:hemerythrin-like domain-containing protein
MGDPISVWHQDHVKFAQLLDLLEAQVAAFHGGEQPNYELIGDVVFYMRSFADCVHHPREDVAFARLVAHEPALELVVNRLLQEHRVIVHAGDELLARLDEAAEDVLVPRAALESAAATYLVYYRQHLLTEERDIMPRAAQALTGDDWAAVAQAVPALADPLFGLDVQARFRELRRQIDREARVSLRA